MAGKAQAFNGALAPVPPLFLIAESPPPHHLDRPLREGALVTPGEHGRLLAAATKFLRRVVERHREVVALIAAGLSKDEISRTIYLSPSTAKTHAARGRDQLGARDRAQLVVFAYQAGLVRPGWAS
jgi:DNA-binding NarL/FixJ family response regulator